MSDFVAAGSAEQSVTNTTWTLSPTMTVSGTNPSDVFYGAVYTLHPDDVNGFTIGAFPMNGGTNAAMTMWLDQVKVWARP